MIPIRDFGRAPIFPIAVYGLIALNVAVFYQEFSIANDLARARFIDDFALIPYDLIHGVQLAAPAPPTWTTLVTSQFLHGSILHIFFNMLFFAVFGPEIEYVFGHVRFVFFYLACGILGNLAEVAVMPGSHVPGIGASGAIAGVLGAFIIRFPTNSVETIVPIGCFPLFLRLPAFVVIGIWAALQFVQGFAPVSSRVAAEQSGGVAYFAHIGGFIAGVLGVSLFGSARAKPQGRRYRYYY